jgi:hypothetical protein
MNDKRQTGRVFHSSFRVFTERPQQHVHFVVVRGCLDSDGLPDCDPVSRRRLRFGLQRLQYFYR